MNPIFPKQRILLVDDEKTNIKILATALRADYHISFALNGEAALKMACDDELPDIILLDIMLPGLDGYEVCKRLKADARTRHIPVIFVTAMTDVSDETRGLDIGAVDYIAKPFSMPIIKARVRTHLELKRHRDVLERLSSYDGLTGIPNRRRFDEYLELEWKRAVREATPLSIIMIDIDHFKRFNDTYGHCAGDDCLRQVAAALAGSVHRPSDLVARYGGEEFVAVLPKTDSEGATFIAETMRHSVSALLIPNAGSDTCDHLTISLGTATCLPNENLHSSSLIDAGDRSLYEAKRCGRNQVKSLMVD